MPVISGDISLPRTTLKKIALEILPDHTIDKNALELISDCCTEFITMLVFEANNLMEEDGKKTMTIEHLLQAFSDLGYPEYIELLKEKAEEFNATHQIKVKRKKKLVRDFTMSAEGLLAEQERLFNVSRERFESVTEMELVAGESGFYISAMIQDEEVELQCHSSEILKMAERIQIDLEDDNFNTYENSTPKGVNEPLEKYAHELYLSFLDNPAITVAHGGGGLHKDASGRDDGATAENGISHCDGFHKIPIKHLDKGKGRT